MRQSDPVQDENRICFAPIFDSPVSKEEEAYRGIKDYLFTGGMSAGQKIVYAKLERLLGMSKTPIIGALARLAQEGIVKLEHNRGYFVRKFEPAEIRQIYEIRIRMEELAIEYAVENASQADFELLKQALDAYISYGCPTYDAYRLNLDLAFHLQIARMGGNPFLVPLLEQLYDQTRFGLPAVFMTPLIPRFKEDHVHLFEAIAACETEKAKTLIHCHEWRTLKLLEEQR